MAKREFELDLTSVCVATGVLQLPMKMQEYFRSGDLSAVVDGEELLVRFTEPRRLAGFKEHFERRGLRCNDKVQFQVEMADGVATGLVASSIKRERSRPSTHHADTPAGPSERPTHEAATGAVGHTERASSWGTDDLGGQVRAVRRVRIEGASPLPVSGPNRFRAEGAQAHQRTTVDAERSDSGQGQVPAYGSHYSRWAPLDGVSSAAYKASSADLDFAETTVREIRRSKQSIGTFDDLVVGTGHVDAASSVDESTLTDETEAASDFPPLYAHGEVVEERSSVAAAWSAEASARPAAPDRAVPAGETVGAASDGRGPVAAPRIPVPRNTAVGAVWQPTPAADLDLDDVSPQRQPRLIEERELVPVPARFEAPATSERSGFQSPAQAQAGFQSAPQAQEGRGEATDRPATASVRAAAPRAAIDDSDFGGEYLPAGGALESALRAKQQERLAFDADARLSSSPERVAARSDEVVSAGSDAGPSGVPLSSSPASAESTSVAEAGGRLSGAESVPAASPRVEDDLRLVQNYLSRPNTPAIVRSEVIAAELGIDDQRSERALERLSEDRDRVSRIRKGAYMVKSMPSSHSQRI